MNSVQKIGARYGERILLALIILAGLGLRLYHIRYQSLWIDEINTAIESDPALRDHGLWEYLRGTEQQPPLFFLLEQASIWLFGNNEASLRLVPALAGTASIWAIYMLGKELKNGKVGLYAAILFAVNSFSIHFSQEARPYALVLFLCILSWLFLLKFLRSVNLRNCLLYAAVTLTMLYSNYFGLLVLAAQVIVSGIILWKDEPQKKKLFYLSLLAGTIIAVGFIPLIPLLQGVGEIKKFWGEYPKEDVAINYFFAYFGPSDLLKPLLLLLLISFFTNLFLELKRGGEGIKNRPLLLTFLICCVWIFIGYFIPYLRSILVVPMMVPRYTITILPAFILLLAFGLEEIASKVVGVTLISIFCLLSLTHIFIVKNYDEISKTQFRELAKYMSSDTAFMFPVVTETTGWHQRYYLGKNHYGGNVLQGKSRLRTVDSLLKLPERTGFWLTGAHIDHKPDDAIYRLLDSTYIMLKEVHLFDCWGQLFIPKDYYGPGTTAINAKNVPQSERYYYKWEELIPMWGPDFSAPPVKLKAGNYKYIVVARGSIMNGTYAHLHCYVNGQELGSYYLSKYQAPKAYEFSLRTDTTATLSFFLDNDASNPNTNEDRNVFIHALIIAPKS